VLTIQFDDTDLPAQAEALREDVRAFLAEAMPRDQLPDSDFNQGHSPAFSRALGSRGADTCPRSRAANASSRSG
jgi:hypothetical protein